MLLGCLITGAVLNAQAVSAEVVVVVAADSPVSSLSAPQVANLFLGKSRAFPNGGEAAPVDQPEGSAVRKEFYARMLKKNAAQMTAYWAKVIFTGDGHPPQQLRDSLEVRNSVAHDRHAVGYIDAGDVNSSVRVVYRLGNSE